MSETGGERTPAPGEGGREQHSGSGKTDDFGRLRRQKGISEDGRKEGRKRRARLLHGGRMNEEHHSPPRGWMELVATSWREKECTARGGRIQWLSDEEQPK